MKKSIIVIALCLAAFALPAQAVEYPEKEFRTTSSYIEQTQQVNPNMQYGTFTPADALLLGSEEQTGANGGGPRRTVGNTGTPGSDGQLLPVGDAALPLTLMALAFCGVIYLRRSKA